MNQLKPLTVDHTSQYSRLIDESWFVLTLLLTLFARLLTAAVGGFSRIWAQFLCLQGPSLPRKEASRDRSTTQRRSMGGRPLPDPPDQRGKFHIHLITPKHLTKLEYLSSFHKNQLKKRFNKKLSVKFSKN